MTICPPGFQNRLKLPNFISLQSLVFALLWPFSVDPAFLHTIGRLCAIPARYWSNCLSVIFPSERLKTTGKQSRNPDILVYLEMLKRVCVEYKTTFSLIFRRCRTSRRVSDCKTSHSWMNSAALCCLKVVCSCPDWINSHYLYYL